MNDRGLKVLEQYEPEVRAVKRGRGSYICDTDQGIKLLCDFSGSEKKLQFQNNVLRRLQEAGIREVDPVLETREKKLYAADREGNRYVLKDWFEGKECDIFSESDLIRAAERLAEIHRHMRFPDMEKEYCGQLLVNEFRSRTRELRKVRAFIREKQQEHPYERLYLYAFPRFYEQAVEAEYMASAVCTADRLGRQIAGGGVCHGDYSYHHVLFLKQGIAVTDFQRCCFDYQIYDLARFLRKTMEKHDWNVRIGMKLIEAYDRVRTIPEEERKLLYLKLAYPEKFWKLANHYYGSRKAWIPERFVQKLEALIVQYDRQNNFLKMLE